MRKDSCISHAPNISPEGTLAHDSLDLELPRWQRCARLNANSPASPNTLDMAKPLLSMRQQATGSPCSPAQGAQAGRHGAEWMGGWWGMRMRLSEA